VTSQEVNLGDLLSELKSTYDVPADKDLALEWIYPADLPSVKTDRDRLEKILRNLIDNAVKFTEKGKVTVSARFFADSGKAEFEVEDTGIGIPEESLPVIFDIFRQADSSDRRAYEGVGLGLYIARKLTHLLGGVVEVKSEPGRGSRFKVTIPDMREKAS
jgi:signal transduction histidine kinase